MKIKILLTLIGLSTAACSTTAPEGGGGGGGQPPPPQRAPLPLELKTADGDGITVLGGPGNGNGPVRFCLTTTTNMWKKEIAISGGATLRSEKGTQDCTNVDPSLTRFQIRKAKAFGVVTPVGNGTLDLTGYGGGHVTITWQRD